MPGFDPENKDQMERLRRAVHWSVLSLATARNQYKDNTRLYAGGNWGTNRGPTEHSPVPLVEMYVDTVSRYMGYDPSAFVTAKPMELRDQAVKFQMALDKNARELELGRVGREAVKSAMLAGMGVTMVGLNLAGSTELHGRTFFQDEPFATPISFSTWFHDMSAPDLSCLEYEGNQFRVPLDQLLDYKLATKGLQDKLQASGRSYKTLSGDDDVAAMAHEPSDSDVEIYDHIDLLNIYLPMSNLLLVVPADGPFEAVRIIEWDGPHHGPFHKLWFELIPGSSVPHSPIASVKDLHVIANDSYEKLTNQFMEEKTVLGYSGVAAEDAERLVRASDMDKIKLNHPQGLNIFKFSGMDANGQAFFLNTKQLFDWAAGNLSSLAGLGPQADTARQEDLISQTSSRKVKAMQEDFMAYMRGILRHLAWYEWTDPIRKRMLTRRIPGTSVEIQTEWSAETRRGNFLDFDIDIEAYKSRHQSPSEKAMQLNQFVQGVLMPSLQFMQAAGVGIDWVDMLKTLARYQGLSEVENWFIEGIAGADQYGSNPMPTMSPNTKRTYERINRPGMTNQGHDQAMSLALMGAAQPAQTKSIGRAAG
jgi:hypothetical protein